jgi:predicted DNA-binding transcriptional regulator AlpA
MTDSAPVFLSRKELMKMLGGISYETLNKYIADGLVPPGVPFGARDRWDRDAVIERLQSRMKKQRAQSAA